MERIKQEYVLPKLVECYSTTSFYLWMSSFQGTHFGLAFSKHANMGQQKKAIAKISSMCPLRLLNQIYKNA